MNMHLMLYTAAGFVQESASNVRVLMAISALLHGSMLAPYAASVFGASRVACTCARNWGMQIPFSKCSYICSSHLCGNRNEEKEREERQRAGSEEEKKVQRVVSEEKRGKGSGTAKQGSFQPDSYVRNTRCWRW